MADVDQSLFPGVPLPVQILVPRREPWERPLQKRLSVRVVLGEPVDMQRGGGVDRRLDQAGGLVVAWGVGAALRVPEPDPRKVLAEVRVEDDLRQEAVLPLAVEEVVQLVGGPTLIVVRVPDSDKGRVPGPLVRVESRARLRVATDPVEVQDHLRPPDEQSQVVRHVLVLVVGCAPPSRLILAHARRQDGAEDHRDNTGTSPREQRALKKSYRHSLIEEKLGSDLLSLQTCWLLGARRGARVSPAEARSPSLTPPAGKRARL